MADRDTQEGAEGGPDAAAEAGEGHYASVRVRLIKDGRALKRAAEHGARRDKSAVDGMRHNADPDRRALGWTLGMAAPAWIGTTEPGDPLPEACDYPAALDRQKEATGAETRKAYSLGVHIMCIVSPAWLAEAGDPHSMSNPHIRAGWTQSRAWAEDTLGQGSVIGQRFDLDEAGSGVFELICAPVRSMKLGRSPEPRLVISPNQAFRDFAIRRNGKETSYKAGIILNDSWAEWAQTNLSPTLQRGRPKSETGRRNIAPAEYRRRMAELEAERDRLLATIATAKKRIEALLKYVDSHVAWIQDWAEVITDFHAEHPDLAIPLPDINPPVMPDLEDSGAP